MNILRAIPGRRPLLTLAAAATVAGALFGAGFLSASALGSDDNAPTGASVGPANVSGAGSTGMAMSPRDSMTIVPAGAPPQGTSDAVKAGGGGSATYGIAPAPWCPADLPAIITGPAIDLAAAGVTVATPGDGYALRWVSLRSQADCDANGKAAGEAVVVVETTWLQVASGLEVTISQRAEDTPAPNVLTPWNGQAWVDGVLFSAWVNAYPIQPVDMPAGPEKPADTRADAVAEAVLREALARVAPSVAAQCYFVQREGSWADLASIGVGDPRPAIPAGLAEQFKQFVTFTAPPADCKAVALEHAGSFSASWGDTAGRSVSVNAYAGAMDGERTGYIDDSSASWVNGGVGYNVAAYGPQGGMGREVVEKIARALDPDFASACFIQTRQLAEAELGGLGFRAPVAPEGFRMASADLQVTGVPAGGGCSDTPDAAYYPQYNLWWTMEDGKGAVIEAHAARSPQQGKGGEGMISDVWLAWQAADGTFYSVYGYSKDGQGTASRDALIAVAKSMDPSLDVSKLPEGGKVMPMDAPRIAP